MRSLFVVVATFFILTNLSAQTETTLLRGAQVKEINLNLNLAQGVVKIAKETQGGKKQSEFLRMHYSEAEPDIVYQEQGKEGVLRISSIRKDMELFASFQPLFNFQINLGQGELTLLADGVSLRQFDLHMGQGKFVLSSSQDQPLFTKLSLEEGDVDTVVTLAGGYDRLEVINVVVENGKITCDLTGHFPLLKKVKLLSKQERSYSLPGGHPIQGSWTGSFGALEKVEIATQGSIVLDLRGKWLGSPHLAIEAQETGNCELKVPLNASVFVQASAYSIGKIDAPGFESNDQGNQALLYLPKGHDKGREKSDPLLQITINIPFGTLRLTT